ncbi:type VI secretion system toxin TseL [Vibrio cholerae]|uniref:type VI secretion system toxin TseL n=4 Tax=Vibrio cholerae TaxID=666 RepID=UPI000E0C9D8D|nr:type VI secretion system toxin TseL [Vibrio cholerae]EKF9069042.1 lipase [Vibrio cholerae]MCR9699671.1 lipase [Vibrio cholerae]MCR9971083.1 lipase [Vibrio cholerae]TQP39663.1 lipase [Vibrio cholerae]TXX59599.1 lipase [Vibrio cholerae]
MDSFNYCVQCNPEENWLELEFRSENDEPIDGLLVTITSQSAPSNTYTQTTSSGKVLFGKIAAGEWRASVSQASLLTEVEKYASRKEGQESPVKKRAAAELDAADKDTKQYRFTTIGDFWDEAPEDEFLQEQHKGIDVNASAEKAGFRLSHNQTYVFEIKALRSYMPVIIDTDEFNLVNSYTFALLSKLAYATNDFNRDDGKTTDNQGAISTVISQLKRKERPTYSGDLQAKWLLEEIPYSKALGAKYYAEDDVGSEGYIIFNDELAIIGVRGTEPYFQSKKPPVDNTKFKIIKAASGMAAVIADKIESATDSPGMKDLIITDLDAAQIAPEEFGGAYVHRGFYQYSMALWKNTLLADDILNNHSTKRFYLCGHSLGGAGALLLSALIKDSYHPPVLRLYTYGMPRVGTRSFVERYQNILHYRHVNNHDLVPQIPTVWMNTDVSEGFHVLDVFKSRVDLMRKMLTDDDDDNYQHHGHLSQLLTYNSNNQVLLTPKQTQVTMLDLANLATNDSVAMVDGLSDASIVEHGMEQYIPNLFEQLTALSDESLMVHYQRAISALEQEIATLQQSYLTVKQAWIESIGNGTPTMNIGRLMSEMHSINKLIENRNKIRGELRQIVSDPQRMPATKFLISQQTLPDEIKVQIR